jgi:hypothetical protein
MSRPDYFSEPTPYGNFMIRLREDPNRPGGLQVETELIDSGLIMRAGINEEFANRLADALQRWYASPFETEEIEMNGFGT